MDRNGQHKGRRLKSGDVRFKLTLLRKSVVGTADVSALWLCRCECGTELLVSAREITRKHKKSCGCLQELHRSTFGKTYGAWLTKDPTSAGCSSTIARCKYQAKCRKIAWELTRDDCKRIFAEDCTYCGDPPNQVCVPVGGRKIPFVYNGIDRVDSSKGYTADNCVACCRWCNLAKSVRDVHIFLRWASRIAERNKSG